MTSSDGHYKLLAHSTYQSEEQSVQHSKVNVEEIMVNELSGDEAMEIGEGSIHISIRQKDQKASLFLSGITVMKSMVGVGILGLPNVAKNFGILPTILLVLFVFICTNFSTNLLIRSKNMSRHSNYTTIGNFLYESKSSIIIINLIIIFCTLGTCLGMLIIFGTTCENLVSIFENDTEKLPFYLKRWFLIIIIGILLMPLMIVKSIERLRFVSLIAVLSLTSFTIIIIQNFISSLINGKLASDYGLFPNKFDFKEAFGALPNVILAFNWTFNQFPIYKGMINPSDARMQKSAWMGTSLGTLLYLIVAILGYMTYGSKVQTNFLKTIQLDDVGQPLYIFLNISFTLSTTLTLPLMFFGSRNNCISIMNQINWGQKNTHDADEYPVKFSHEQRKKIKQQEKIKFYVTSIFLEVMLIVGAIYLTQLEVVFNLLGAIGSNAILYTLPALFFFKCVDKVKLRSQLNTQEKNLYFTVKGYFYYSLILVVVCVGSEILRIAQGEG